MVLYVVPVKIETTRFHRLPKMILFGKKTISLYEFQLVSINFTQFFYLKITSILNRYSDKYPIPISKSTPVRIPEKYLFRNSKTNLKTCRFKKPFTNFISNLTKCLSSNPIKCITPRRSRSTSRYRPRLPYAKRVYEL